MVTECEFVGHLVTTEGIRAPTQRIADIVDFNTPKNADELRSFLGVASYCKKFVKNFAEHASCLFALLQKGRKFQWSDECANSFEAIKRQMLAGEILAHPDFEKSFAITSDASNSAIGFTLSQEQDGEMRPNLYGGRVLSRAEKNYCTTDRELLGCYYAVKRCEYFVSEMTLWYIQTTNHSPT